MDCYEELFKTFRIHDANTLGRHVAALGGLQSLEETLEGIEGQEMYHIGSGHFSAVFGNVEKDENWVYKVGPLSDGWLIYASFCLSNESPFGLSIMYINRHEKEGYYVAKIERCEQTAHDWWNEAHDMCFNMNIQSDSFRVSAKYEEHYPGLTSFLLKVHRHGRRTGTCNDLHSKNAMYRADGSLCITDPFSYGSEILRDEDHDETYFRWSSADTQGEDDAYD